MVVAVAPRNVGRIEHLRDVLVVPQVASTSRGITGPSSSRGGGSVGNTSTTPGPIAGAGRNAANPTTQERRVTSDGAPQVLTVCKGDLLPEGYTLVVRAPPTPTATPKSLEMVDLNTPPNSSTHMAMPDVETSKRRGAEQQNDTKNSNRKANASFAKEVRDSLAQGRPPTLNVNEEETYLKTRWHSAAKEVAYIFLDIRKESWRAYTMFENTLVHKELNVQYKFDSPLDPKRVDKYLCRHLHSARAVWKAHWLQYGDDAWHPNCPEEAWQKLIRWWPSQACREEPIAHGRTQVVGSELEQDGSEASRGPHG